MSKPKASLVIPFAVLGAIAAGVIAVGGGWITMERKVERHEATAAQVDRLESKVDRLSARVQDIAVDVARIASRSDRQVMAKDSK